MATCPASDSHIAPPGDGRCATRGTWRNGDPMSRSARTTRPAASTAPVAPVDAPAVDPAPVAADGAPDAPVAAPVATCRIVRPSARGDWYATIAASAFVADDGTADASGPFVRIVGDGDDATASIRFGGRGGAMIAATPDDGTRAAVVVASVRAMRAVPASYRNDARPGAIPSPVVAIAMGTARNIRDGAAIRRTLGRIPASRRVANVPRVTAAASAKFGTVDPFATPADDAGGDAAPDA